MLIVYGAESIDAKTENTIIEQFIFGDYRMVTQDFEFILMQLVEIATRALSPGINDPFTAINCIDRIGVALCRLTSRRMPPSCLYDNDCYLRLILKQTNFESICDTAFNQIRQNGKSSAAVTIRLLETLHKIARQAQTDEQRATLERQALMVYRGGMELPELLDRKDLTPRYKAVMAAWKN